MAAIFGISALHQPPLPRGVSDHSGHALGYFILAVLLIRALADARLAAVTWGRAGGGVVLATLYGLTDEFHQRFVPGRTPAWDDVAADFAGALAGAAFVGILYIINKLWRTRT
jgi:VanZ family protein